MLKQTCIKITKSVNKKDERVLHNGNIFDF